MGATPSQDTGDGSFYVDLQTAITQYLYDINIHPCSSSCKFKTMSKPCNRVDDAKHQFKGLRMIFRDCLSFADDVHIIQLDFTDVDDAFYAKKKKCDPFAQYILNEKIQNVFTSFQYDKQKRDGWCTFALMITRKNGNHLCLLGFDHRCHGNAK